MKPEMDRRAPRTTGRPSGDDAEKTGQVEISDPDINDDRSPGQGPCAADTHDACGLGEDERELIVPSRLVVGSDGVVSSLVEKCPSCGLPHLYPRTTSSGLGFALLCDERIALLVPGPAPAVFFDSAARRSRKGWAAMQRLGRGGFAVSSQVPIPDQPSALPLGELRVRRRVRRRFSADIFKPETGQ